MKKATGYALELAGLAGLCFAGWLVSEPLGIFLAAACLLFLGIALGRET